MLGTPDAKKKHQVRLSLDDGIACLSDCQATSIELHSHSAPLQCYRMGIRSGPQGLAYAMCSYIRI